MVAVARITDLTVEFGDHLVVDGLSFRAERGRTTVLHGANGSGKTTVLRCLVGMQTPSSGTVEVLGRPIDESSVWFRKAVACVLDDIDFLPGLSVVQQLELIARAHRVPEAEAEARSVLDELKIVQCAAQEPSTLSSGQRHRLGLGTALVRPADLVIFDEPEQRLDVDGIAWITSRINRLCADGAAVVIASHDETLIDGLDSGVVIDL